MHHSLFILLFFGSVVISTFSQILLKKSSLSGKTGLKFYLNRLSVLAYGLFFLATLTSLICYRHITLLEGQIMEASGFLLIALFSYVVFHESISRRYLCGLGLILAGYLVYFF